MPSLAFACAEASPGGLSKDTHKEAFLGPPDLRGWKKVGTGIVSVVYFRRGTLPQKRGENGHYWGT